MRVPRGAFPAGGTDCAKPEFLQTIPPASPLHRPPPQTTHPTRPPHHPPHPTSEGVTPSGDHSTLKFYCGAAASSVRFKQQLQSLRRFGGTPQGPLGNAYSGSALTVSNLNGAFVAGALPGSPHCTSKEGCGQTCNFVQGQLKCEDNIKSGSGSGSGSR
jgi:hypothetical protein